MSFDNPDFVDVVIHTYRWVFGLEAGDSALKPLEGIVRITEKRRHWTKNVERLCGTELAPLGESGGTVQLEIFAAVEVALLIEMIVYG